MTKFLYTVRDIARLCQVCDMTIWNELTTLGLAIFNENDGEYYTTFASTYYKEVRDNQIYWKSDIVDEIFIRLTMVQVH